MLSYSLQREALSHGMDGRSSRQTRGNAYMTGVTPGKFRQIFQTRDSHPRIMKETRLRPDIVIHLSSTQQLIIVELTVPYESRMEEAHTYKREKNLNLTKELRNAGYRSVEVGAKGFVGSSAYDLLIKLSICGTKRTKALKLLKSAEIAENSSR